MAGEGINIFRRIIERGVRYRTRFEACQERKLISAFSCASGGAMPKERAVSITVDTFHSSISAYRQEADPERKKIWRRLVRDHLAWLRSHEIPKDVSTRSPWIPEKQWSTVVRVDLDGETREPHDLNELISWLKQFTRRKHIGQMYITMSCERSPVEVEMDVEKEAGNAATE